MITENLPALKIHKLSKEQYERELANGNIDPTALYLTPDTTEEEIEELQKDVGSSKESFSILNECSVWNGRYITSTNYEEPRDGCVTYSVAYNFVPVGSTLKIKTYVDNDAVYIIENTSSPGYRNVYRLNDTADLINNPESGICEIEIVTDDDFMQLDVPFMNNPYTDIEISIKKDTVWDEIKLLDSSTTGIRQDVDIIDETVRYMQDSLGQYSNNIDILQNRQIESTEYPGCYYRMVDGETEWINPPLVIGVAYRTTERYNDKPVYIKAAEFPLSASGEKVVAIEHSITHVVSIDGVVKTADLVSLPIVGYGDGFKALGNGNFITNVTVEGGTAYPIVKYTK